MKAISLRCCDYLDWLKEEEEYLLWCIEVADDAGDLKDAIDYGEQLQIVREIKEIVGKWEEKNVN